MPCKYPRECISGSGSAGTLRYVYLACGTNSNEKLEWSAGKEIYEMTPGQGFNL